MSSSYLLHFDLSQGCLSHALCEALLNLGANLSSKAPQQDQLEPIPLELFKKASSLLNEAGYQTAETDLDLLRNFCQLLTTLNPSAISASRIPLAFHPDDSNRAVILKLSHSLPVYEREWPAPHADAPGIALIKTCASHIGSRGDSVLLNMGSSKDQTVRVLWCQKSSAQTTSKQELLELSAFLPNPFIIGELSHRLTQLGAQQVSNTAVTDQHNHGKTLFTVIAPESAQYQIIEAMLIIGQSPDVMIKHIERQSLHKRVISVVLGKSQKQQVCRVTEYLWGDKILRADPLQEDLEALSRASGHPQDIIRADVLAAWKRRTDSGL
ncbi:MAG: hypothetical protein JKY15_03245 [Deltaproteobacteria bacterium]|nr:hypothetical protein [Deltaproteobacteria bacterium]